MLRANEQGAGGSARLDESRGVGAGQSQAVAAALLFAVGAAYLIKALSYGLGTLADPGVGSFPALVGVVWELAAVVLLWRGLSARGQKAGASPPLTRGGVTLRIVLAGAGSVGFIVASPLVGFAPPAMLLAVLCLVGGGERRWLPLTAVAVAALVLAWGVLVALMGLPAMSLL